MRSLRIGKRLLFLLALLSQAEELPKGKVIDWVACKTRGHSYALYLPSGYDDRRAWPILYCFDSRARGGLAVRQFRIGAEKYGYIVAGSNNSQNGSMKPIIEAVNALWNDTQSRFKIDPKRIYASGFSGGARVALALGNIAPPAGVIACGAAAPPPRSPQSISFPFYGIVGTQDFNLREFLRADRTLDEAKVPHLIRQFPGGHEWPPASICADALGWMEAEAKAVGH